MGLPLFLFINRPTVPAVTKVGLEGYGLYLLLYRLALPAVTLPDALANGFAPLSSMISLKIQVEAPKPSLELTCRSN